MRENFPELLSRQQGGPRAAGARPCSSFSCPHAFPGEPDPTAPPPQKASKVIPAELKGSIHFFYKLIKAAQNSVCTLLRPRTRSPFPVIKPVPPALLFFFFFFRSDSKEPSVYPKLFPAHGGTVDIRNPNALPGPWGWGWGQGGSPSRPAPPPRSPNFFLSPQLPGGVRLGPRGGGGRAGPEAPRASGARRGWREAPSPAERAPAPH